MLLMLSLYLLFKLIGASLGCCPGDIRRQIRSGTGVSPWRTQSSLAEAEARLSCPGTCAAACFATAAGPFAEIKSQFYMLDLRLNRLRSGGPTSF